MVYVALRSVYVSVSSHLCSRLYSIVVNYINCVSGLIIMSMFVFVVHALFSSSLLCYVIFFVHLFFVCHA